jgi:hypothetical protein
MLCFFLFWLFQFPFLLLHPSRLRWFFFAKSVLVPTCFLSLFIWALARGGKGEIFNRPTTISGSELGWAFMSCLNSVLGNYATLASRSHHANQNLDLPKLTHYAPFLTASRASTSGTSLATALSGTPA